MREKSKLRLTTSVVGEDISLIIDCLFLLKKKEKRKEEGANISCTITGESDNHINSAVRKFTTACGEIDKKVTAGTRKYERWVAMAKYLYPPSFPFGILKNKLATTRAANSVCGVIGFWASKWKNLDYMSCDGSCLASLFVFERV